MANNTKAQKAAKRAQEDAALNRIFIWFGGAVVAEFILLLLNRFIPDTAVLQALVVAVPVVAILAMIFYLFQRDFFCICVICAGGLLSLQLYRKLNFEFSHLIRAGYVLAFALLAIALILLILQQFGKAPAILDKLVPQDSNRPLLYVSCVLNAAVLAITMALGSSMAYYLIFVLVAWLFIMAVYYIVKLM